MRLWKWTILFYIGGMLYVTAEHIFRGWSHPSMFVVGGLCFLLVGALNQGAGARLPLLVQALLGAAIITGMELVSGLIVNVYLGWAVWDYSHLPLNFKGQICAWFFLLWIPMACLAVVTDDYLRHWLFGEGKPVYRLV